MLTQTQKKLLMKGLWMALAVLLLWVFFRWGLGVAAPFLIALLISRLIEPLVLKLVKQLRWPRWLASAVCVVVSYLLLFGFCYLLVSQVLVEVGGLLRRLPEWMAGLPDFTERLTTRVRTLIIAAPIEMQDFLNNTLNDVISQGANIPQGLYSALGGFVTGAAAAVPNVLLFLVTSILSTVFVSGDYPHVSAFIVRQLPDKWRERLLRAKGHLTGTLGKWLKAQLLLMGITFALLCIGFVIIGVEYPLIVAAVVALVDALPVVGLGIVLIPWAIVAFLTVGSEMGIGLLVLFLVCSLTRSFAEPKLVGKQIGLHPLITLVAMYVGFRVFGVLGMILCPVLAITLRQMQTWGYVKLWK